MSNKEKLIHALEKNELRDFLEGNGIYRIEYHELSVMTFPNDVQACLGAVYSIYNEYPHIKMDEKLKAELHSMLEAEPYAIYMAVNILSFQTIYEEKKIAPFSIVTELLEHTKESLSSHKDKLIAYKEHEGSIKENGVWDVLMTRYNNIEYRATKLYENKIAE